MDNLDTALRAIEALANELPQSATDKVNTALRAVMALADEISQPSPTIDVDTNHNTADTSYKTEGTAKDNKKTATFLDLTAELRNDLYTLALVNETFIRMHVTRRASGNWSLVSEAQEPALLRASKQIRTEALPLYYGNNVFNFSKGH